MLSKSCLSKRIDINADNIITGVDFGTQDIPNYGEELSIPNIPATPTNGETDDAELRHSIGEATTTGLAHPGAIKYKVT